MDCAPGLLAGGSSPESVWSGGGRPAVSGVRLLDGTQVSGPIPSSGSAGAGDEQAVGFGGPGHDHCTIAPLHITIPASGSTGGRCRRSVSCLCRFPACRRFPAGFLSPPEVTVLDASPESVRFPDPAPVDLPDIQIHDPVYLRVPEEDPMDVSTEVSELNIPLPPPPPGFECFVWPKAIGGPGGDSSLFDFSAELPGWFPMGLAGASGDQLSLPILRVGGRKSGRLPERVRYTFWDWRPAGRSFGISTGRSIATDIDFARRGFLRHSGLSGQSGSLWVSGPCSTLVVGPGGPFSFGTITFVSEMLWGWLFFPSYRISSFGLH